MQEYVREILRREGELLLNDLRPLVSHRSTTPREGEELAREILVQSAQVALENADKFDPERSFRLWFLGIARNCLKQKYSTYEKRTFSTDSYIDFLETLQNAQTGDFADAVINRVWVEALLALLPSDDQEILRLSVVEGHSSDEIGTLLKIAPGTARMRLLRALQRARVQAERMERVPSVRGSR